MYEPSLRVGELARATGISVRTLHHYETIGLLHPSGRTSAGHRVYLPKDLERLQQILSLKDLGLRLAEIQICLDRDRASLQQVLKSHCRALERRILAQDRMLQRLDALVARVESGSSLSVPDLLKSLEEMKVMQEDSWIERLMDAMRLHAEKIGAENFKAAQAENREIMVLVGEAYRRGAARDSAEVRELAERSQRVRLVITGGDPQLAAQLRRLNDQGFARQGPEGYYTDPALIAFLESSAAATEH